MEILTQPQQAVLIAAGLVALCLILVLVSRITRLRRVPHAPVPRVSTPYLESSDGCIHLPTDVLSGAGAVIGRGPDADLIVGPTIPHAESVSERHARIYQDSITGHVMIEDLDSANGVFINGRRAPRRNLLKDGWIIGLGSLTLAYHDGYSDTGPLE